MTRRGAAQPEVYRITGARRSHTDDLNQRINRYLVSMAIRTACVVLVFVVPGPLRWVFAAGAIFLPYVAVIFANASDRRSGTGVPVVDHRGLTAGSSPREAAAPVVLEGRVVTGPRGDPESDH